ncbi:mitochondrial protein Pet127-domain-containing protein [Cadophora sp. MPI-SDFR-AT-0126]|nr:mitochondrial protein Pet127-domain-containing protein [Leotiomycetes sp. MPI-SDFR-AT-0126]
MFSTLSRGSSRVRQTYICSACRCNILAHANSQQIHLPGSGATQATSNAFSTSAPQSQADDGEFTSAEASNGKDAEPTSGRRESMRRRSSRTPLSKSMSTLRALRESLLAEPVPPPPQRQPLAKETPASKSSSKLKKAKSPNLANSLPSVDSEVSELSNVAADSPANAVPQEAAIGPKGKGNDAGNLTADSIGKKKTPARSGRGKTREKTQSSQKAKAGNEAPDIPHDSGPADLPLKKKLEVPSSKEATKSPKDKKPASKQTAELKENSPGRHTRSWTVIGEDGRKFIVRLDGSSQKLSTKEKAASDKAMAKARKLKSTTSDQVTDSAKAAAAGQPDSVKRANAKSKKDPLTKMTAKLFADYPTIRAKLKDVPDNAGAALLQKRLKKLLQGDQLSEAERLPVLRKLIALRTHGRTAGPRPRLVKPLTIRKCSSDVPVGENKLSIGKRPGSVSTPLGTTAHEIKTVDADSLQLVPLDSGPLQVPKLSYGLERVLFNPGVYQLQDPRSRVYNFDPYLQTIMPVSEFDFNALKQYITSSRDKVLLSKAIAEKKKYTGSTSSMTSALAHFHFLLSQWRDITVSNLSKMFPAEFKSFTAIQRGPVSIFLRWRDGAYAIDADKQFDSANVLMSLGKSMEKLLTLSTEDFEKYRKSNSGQITEEERNASEEFHYTGMGDFLLRSQLDAYDSRLPGTGMFDLKTRAVISVRMDTDAYEDGRGYEIRGQHGAWESFEREYYDMIRSAFLKYSLQVRMGRMDGIFVAYHNTARIFGFQYISLPEMDFALHGTTDTTLGDQEFKLSLDLLNRVLDRATAKYPEQSLRIVIETRPAKTPFTYIFAEPFTETAIEDIQKTSKAKIEKFEKAVLGVVSKEYSEEDQEKEWAKIRARVEESVGDDEAGRDALSRTDNASDLDSDLDNADESGDIAENEDAMKEDVLLEEERELRDIISATRVAEHHAHEGEVDESVEKGSSEGGKHTDLEESEEGEEYGVTGVEESDEDEAAEADESVEADSKNLDEDSEVVSAEGIPDTIESEESDDYIDEDSLPITRVVSGPGSRSPVEPNKKAPIRDMIAMTLTIRNKINGEYQTRPGKLKSTDKWEVEHALSEIQNPERVATLYKMSLERRERANHKTIDLNKDSFNSIFLQRIKNMNQKGREWRKQQSELDKTQPVKVLNVKDGKKTAEKDFGLWTQEEGKGEGKN